jgi:hypothetical protein
VDFSTGTTALTLTATSPDCTATGAVGLECACQTCATAAAEACRTDADCPAGVVCGGSPIGQPTLPNSCTDLICSPTSNGEGECPAGPIEQYCGAPETFLGCFATSDCPLSGVCLPRLRECFLDNGVAGGAVAVTGATNVPVANTAVATLAGVSCLGVLPNPIANAVGGFPGATRMSLPGTMTLAQEIVSRVAAAAATVTTGGVPTATDPVETSVTTPNGGPVTIVEQNVSGTPPPVGYTFVNQQVSISAPSASAAVPLTIVFRLDASRLPGAASTTCGVRRAQIVVQRNGTPISAICTGGDAIPDSPCLASITCDNGDGALSSDVTITVLAAVASVWRFAVPEEPPALPIAAKKLQIKDADDASKRKLTLQLEDTALEVLPFGSDDPTCAGGDGGGATLAVFGAAGTAQHFATFLPCAGWKAIGDPVAGKGYKYTDAKSVHGPCKSVVLKNRKVTGSGTKPGQLKATCAGKTIPLEYDLEVGEGSVGVAFRTGAGAGVCAELGGIVEQDDSERFQAKTAAAPPVCPVAP